MDLLFIVNPIAGGHSKDFLIKLIERNIDRNRFKFTIALTSFAGHAVQLAAESTSDIVIAVGGDGTVHEVAQGLMMRSDGALGIIPCGSGNGLALELGISTKPAKAVRQLSSAEIRTMDSACLCIESGGNKESIPFFNTSGIGIDADVADDFAKAGTRGLLTYVKSAFKVWRGFRPQRVELTLDGADVKSETHNGGAAGKLSLDAYMVTVCNISQWGHNVRIAPDADYRDGLLDVTVVSPFKSLQLPFAAINLLLGRIHKSRFVRTFRCSSLKLKRERPGALHIDGEPLSADETLHYSILPSTLKVFC